MPEIDPAIASLALWCQHRDGPGATQTQGVQIHYGAEFPLLPFPEQTGLLAHHVLHVALRHSARRAEMAEREGGRFDPLLYALACDGIVNDVLLSGGHALPRPAVRAADLVALLPDGAGRSAENVLADWDSDRLYCALSQTRNGQGCEAGEAARAYAKSKRFSEDCAPAPSETSEAPPEVWAARIEAAMQAGRGAGAGIGAAIAHLADLPRAKVPWERHLRRRLARALGHAPRLSHKRPARSWIAREAQARDAGGPVPVFEPGAARDGARPRLVVAIDTSSSITDAELEAFGAEALSAARKSGAQAHLLAFDTEVHLVAPLAGPSALQAMALRRGGGTDFEDVLVRAAALAPTIIVVMTDLDGPLGAPPGAPVLWLVSQTPARPPPFGEVIVRAP